MSVVLMTVSPTPGTSGLQFPATMKRRGRPKGSDTTVIGLRKKGAKVTGFAKLCADDKRSQMLRWLFDGKDVCSTSSQTYKPDTVPEQFRDNLVLSVLGLISAYVDVPYVKQHIRSSPPQWTCAVCSVELQEDDRSVSCDRCLLWVHFSCANLKRAPAKKEWFCRACRQS